jgi:hypothetical protein
MHRVCLPTACNAICKYCTCDIKKENTLYLKELNIQAANENMKFRILFCIQYEYDHGKIMYTTWL